MNQHDPSQNLPLKNPNRDYQQPQAMPQAGLGMVATPMSVKEWFMTMLVCAIPIANIVMLLVWGFGSNGNLNRKNWSKAALIMTAIWIVIYTSVIVVYVIYINLLSFYAY